MVFGILVVYSENYFAEALIEFHKILKLTSSQYKLIVVINNTVLAEKYKTFPVQHIKFEVVFGSNIFHEFSGWQEGLDFIKNNHSDLYNESGYIFANDTLCKHRKYTPLHPLLFAICSYSVLISSKPKMAGQCLSESEEIDFNDVRFNIFIATYFFTLNRQAIKLMDYKVMPTQELINQYLVGGHCEESFFTEKLSMVLKNRQLNILFNGLWYKSEKLNQNNKEFLYCKARSNLAEMYLSSKAHSNKIKFIDTYLLIKLMNRIFNKIPILRKYRIY